jgi:hypothetical protein
MMKTVLEIGAAVLDARLNRYSAKERQNESHAAA